MCHRSQTTDSLHGMNQIKGENINGTSKDWSYTGVSRCNVMIFVIKIYFIE